MTTVAHQAVGLIIGEGDHVVDATAGNGYDTVYLAQKVGPSGRVYAFDIRHEAISVTKQALQKTGLLERVTLIHAGHEAMTEYISGKVQAVIFNLGYLPGCDRHTPTRYESTLCAVKQALLILKPGGIISVVLYPGHREGRLEKDHLLPFCGQLSASDYTVLYVNLYNQLNNPPELVVIQKLYDDNSAGSSQDSYENPANRI